ncbi:galactose oxidase [Actinokineospora cianjurensis]|uniref:Galactose oxidase n=1 Tax=Actinokineospora cianjurensis TaxID=585224 RepID=A0A421B1P9_9PSEU|nr:galactose oxidase [Actinokineospora cianjurensis]
MRVGRLVVALAVGVVCTPYLMQSLEEHPDSHPLDHQHIVANADALIPTATELPRDGWEAVASTEETAGENGRAANVLDGDPATFWHSQWTAPAPLPQSITIDTKATQRFSGVVYTPRPGGGNGTIGRYEVRLSVDGTTWGNPVAAGTAADDPSVKTFSFAVSGARFVRLISLTEAGNRGSWASAAEIGLLGDPGAPPQTVTLPRTGWTATASDEETVGENGRASNVLDGNPTTRWYSRYDVLTPLPHSITIDLKQPTVLNGLVYRPRPESTRNGYIGEYRITTSTDGTTFGAPVSSGRWADDSTLKHALFVGPTTARYLRLTALTEAGNRGPWSTAAEIELLGSPTTVDPPLPRTGWVATASSSAAGHPAGDALDNRLGTYWQSATTTGTHTFTVDLQREQKVSAIAVTPGPATARITTYAVALSTNGSTFGAPVAQGTWATDGSAKSARFTGTNARYIRLTVAGSITEFHGYGPSTAPGSVAPLPRTGWTAVASDEETVSENGRASNVLDGNGRTIWHSRYSTTTPLPHWITIDMKSARSVAGISVIPRGDDGNGNIGQYQVHVSNDGVTFGALQADGTWPDSSNVQTAMFGATVTARYVRLTALSEARNRGPWTTASEINVLTPAPAPDPSAVGSWGPMIGFPIVPVASALLPNNKLLTWSAYAADTFGGANGYTQTAIYDLTTGQVTQRRIDNTGHDMFCPGTSTLPDGRVLVTGGSNADKASIYDPFNDTWTAAAPMNVARGYQGQTTLATGEAFTVGGSWSGLEGGPRPAEVYSPTTNSWRTLPGIPADPFFTADPRGAYRADNHTWLFAASGGRLFHAGPSKQMHWITTTGNGSVVNAGLRGDSQDAMNGNAVLYDVGKILTVGGATAYQDADATTRAYTVDINGSSPVVARVGDMALGRAFANSVVLPNGRVVVIGGQQRPVPFSDQTAVLTAELWNPATGTFTALAPVAVPRTYHSVANLLPDGRVFSGGGGLCGNCATNHFDGQILTPPYLLNPDGSLKARPTITTAPTTAANGAAIRVTSDRAVTSFALVRTSSSTHSVDNDQRRIPLTPISVGQNAYQLTIPTDRGVALPGHYLLFALDAAGVPSVAPVIKIG